MGMVKAVVSLIVAALLPITSHAVNVVDMVFGVTGRTPYCSLDTRAGVYTVGFWLQDVVYTLAPNRRLVLRYTTSDINHPAFADPTAYTGNMSVYEEQGGSVYVLAEYRIRTNAEGHPVWIDGIQEYKPKKVFSPAEASVQRVPYISSTFGSYTYCPVPRNVFTNIPEGRCSPWDIDNSWYQYNVLLSASDTEIKVGEFYWQSFTTNDFARVFIYNPQDAGRTLVRAYDLPTDTNYYRYRTVTNGVCTDRG